MGKSLIITTGGGTDTTDGNPNVTAAQVLQGYTIYAKTDEPITGKMKNISSPYNGTLWPGYDTWIDAGYYVGNRKYTAVSLDTQTYATATAGQVLNSYKGWNNGALITGSMPNRGAVSSTLAANGTYSVPAGWHNGSGKITQSLSTQGAKTVTPSTANQTIIAASKWTTAAQIVTGNANLSPSNIKKGVTIFGVTGNYQDVNRTDRLYISNYKYLKSTNDNGCDVYHTHAYFLNLPTPIDRTIYKYYWISGLNWHVCQNCDSSYQNTGNQEYGLFFFNRKFTNIHHVSTNIGSNNAVSTFSFSDTINVLEHKFVSSGNDVTDNGAINIGHREDVNMVYSGSDTASFTTAGGSYLNRDVMFPISSMYDKRNSVNLTIHNDGSVSGEWTQEISPSGDDIHLLIRPHVIYRKEWSSGSGKLVIDSGSDGNGSSLSNLCKVNHNTHYSPAHYMLPCDHAWWHWQYNSSSKLFSTRYPLNLSTRVEICGELWGHNDEYTSFYNNTGKIYHIIALFKGASYVKDLQIWFSKTSDLFSTKL